MCNSGGLRHQSQAEMLLHVQYCKCRAGFNFKRLLDNHAQCVPAHTVNVGVLVPAVVFGVVALGLVLLVGTLFLRYKLLPAAAAHHKMKGPPGEPASMPKLLSSAGRLCAWCLGVLQAWLIQTSSHAMPEHGLKHGQGPCSQPFAC